jgi:hypothetical protein
MLGNFLSLIVFSREEHQTFSSIAFKDDLKHFLQNATFRASEPETDPRT